MEEKKEPKWQEEIENLLQYNRTIDEWIIHDYVWEQPSSFPHIDMDQLMQLSRMLTNLIFLSPYSPVKPFPGSDRERWAGIAGMLAEAGCPGEVIDEFFRRVRRLDLPGPPQKDDQSPGEQETG